MKTTGNMPDRARARQERINDSHQRRHRKQDQPGIPVNPASVISEDSANVSTSEPIQNAPDIARHLREQILARSSDPTLADVAPQTSEAANDLRSQMLKEFRLATIKRIEKNEWDEYFQSLIDIFITLSGTGTMASKSKQESE